MPELPEADRIVRQISARCVGRTIDSIDVLRGPYFKRGKIHPRDIIGVRRRGKCPIFVFGDGRTMVSRLGMSGYWDFEDDPWTFDYVEGSRKSLDRDVRVRIGFTTGEVLRYHDSRMFGRLELQPVPRMGKDAIGTMWTYPDHPDNGKSVMSKEEFVAWMRGEQRPVKAALLDQQRIAGVGNIYANEACHLAKIDPTIPGRLAPAERLWRALQSVLTANLGEISYGWLRVYRRQLCGSCRSPVIRLELCGRATFACPLCQIHRP